MSFSPTQFANYCRARDLLLAKPDATIQAAAREAGASPYHFIRRFHSLFGATPHQLRLQHRLQHARIMLARGERSVTDVCFDLGFSSLGSFSTMFTERTGQSPRDFQRQARRLISVPGTLPHTYFPGCLSMMTALPASAFRNFQEASSDPCCL